MSLSLSSDSVRLSSLKVAQIIVEILWQPLALRYNSTINQTRLQVTFKQAPKRHASLISDVHSREKLNLVNVSALQIEVIFFKNQTLPKPKFHYLNEFKLELEPLL